VKLVTFEHAGKTSIGAMNGQGQVVDLAAAGLPGTMVELVAQGEPALVRARALVGGATGGIPLDEVRLLAPIRPRNNIMCIGKNYVDHAKEFAGSGFDASQKQAVPSHPIVFTKALSSLVGPGDVIDVSADTTATSDYEGELAVVIGRICRDVPAEQATDVIFGYTIANDVTARDLQKSDGQWSRAKGFDSFCPLGPWIETDLDPHDFVEGRSVRTYLNGDLKQDGSTKDLIFDIPTLVAHITAAMTLLPGDVILTGTPEGVGPMQVDDEVEVSIAGLGTLTNKIAQR
jgi:2-keto-4-pentenoate hydratase/2-oxohepta-3-ene-1,7-dioic acid hydratase in catechol pathway